MGLPFICEILYLKDKKNLKASGKNEGNWEAKGLRNPNHIISHWTGELAVISNMIAVPFKKDKLSLLVLYIPWIQRIRELIIDN